jgi:hypothetical protein
MTQSNTPRGLSTREIADFMQVTAEGIRVQLCRAGSYHGLQPQRLPNNRLLWPADSRERLLEAGRKMKARTPPGPRSRREGEGVAHG